MRCTNEGGDEEQEDVGLRSRGGVGAELVWLIDCESVCVAGASTTAIGGGGGAPTPAAALEGEGEALATLSMSHACANNSSVVMARSERGAG